MGGNTTVSVTTTVCVAMLVCMVLIVCVAISVAVIVLVAILFTRMSIVLSICTQPTWKGVQGNCDVTQSTSIPVISRYNSV